MSKKVSFDDFKARANIIHNNRYSYDKSTYSIMKNKVRIICPDHGEFYTVGTCHVNNTKSAGCKKCGDEFRAAKRRLSNSDIIKRAKKVHGNKYDYSMVNYKNNNTKVEIICKEHGSFWQTIHDHLGSGAGCPKCGIISRVKENTMTFEEFVLKSKKIHGKTYRYEKESFVNAMSYTKIICSAHGEFLQTPNSHYFGQGCPSCTHIISKSETQWLDSIGILKENRNCKLPGLGKYKVDGWDGNKIVYEFNGSYWHGDPRVFRHDKFNKTTKCTFGDLYKKTMKKAAAIAAAGYQLVTMWEEDYNNLEAKVANSDLSPLVKVM